MLRTRRTVLALLLLAAGPAVAQVRLLPLGDSITHGGQGHASWRYALWDSLRQGGYAVDFVGTQSGIFGGDPPNLTWYPEYLTAFDRDHEGHWGWRTDQVDAIVSGVAAATIPDIALIHLGTNDVGQLGAAGVSQADANLRSIIGRLRGVRPDVHVLLAQAVPIGPGTSYAANAGEIPALNLAIATIAADSTRPGSPVTVVDQFTAFAPAQHHQSDGLHPNTLGEARMASNWYTALRALLVPGNLPPRVELTSPTAGAELPAGTAVTMAASASDADGTIALVRFLVDSLEVALDATAPYEAGWLPVEGEHVFEAVAVDDSGAVRRSAPVRVLVVPAGTEVVDVPDASFESSVLADGALANGPGVIGGWSFEATAATYSGVFDPPAGSYPEAVGAGTPLGADGENVAFLFNNGGPGESVIVRRTLAATLEPASEYRLRVAIGRFLPDQPYAFSTYGGFRVELLAGATVVGAAENTVSPPVAAFTDAVVRVRTDTLPGSLIGQPLGLRFALGSADAPRSTHFDRIRLTRALITVSAPAAPVVRFTASIPAQPLVRRGELRLDVHAPGDLTAEVWDVGGRRVATLARGLELPAGRHRLSLPVLEPGLHFVRLRLGGQTRVIRVSVLARD